MLAQNYLLKEKINFVKE